jgi:hypothetical protein
MRIFPLDIYKTFFYTRRMTKDPKTPSKNAPRKDYFFGITVSKYERDIVYSAMDETGENKSSVIRRIIREWKKHRDKDR